jgi:hypothetical protein
VQAMATAQLNIPTMTVVELKRRKQEQTYKTKTTTKQHIFKASFAIAQI